MLFEQRESRTNATVSSASSVMGEHDPALATASMGAALHLLQRDLVLLSLETEEQPVGCPQHGQQRRMPMRG